MRTCPHPQCGRTIPPHLFACAGHWRTVPKPIQVEILVAYRRYTKTINKLPIGTDPDNNEIKDAIHRLEAAQAEAIRIWTDEP